MLISVLFSYLAGLGLAFVVFGAFQLFFLSRELREHVASAPEYSAPVMPVMPGHSHLDARGRELRDEAMRWVLAILIAVPATILLQAIGATLAG